MTARDWTDVVRANGDDAVLIDVWVEPGSSRPGLGGFDPWRGRLQLRVSAPPEGGRANREVSQLLGGLLGVPPGDVVVARGATSRRKAVRVSGLSRSGALDALGDLLGESRGGGP